MGTVTQPLDKLIARIGFFSLMYFILSATVVCCYFHEQQNRDEWARSFNCNYQAPLPQLDIDVVKYTLTLLTGVATSLWICSRKTIDSWVHFYHQSKEYICGPVGLMAWFKQQGKKSMYQHSDFSACDKRSGKLLKAVDSFNTDNDCHRKTAHSQIDTFSRCDSAMCTNQSVASTSQYSTSAAINPSLRSFVRIEPTLLKENFYVSDHGDCTCLNVFRNQCCHCQKRSQYQKTL